MFIQQSKCVKHICLNCESEEMQKAAKDLVLRKLGLTKIVPAVLGWHCAHCGEVEFLDDESARRVWTAMEELKQQAQVEQAAFIRTTRKKLKLTQQQAARVFGGGKGAFSEYEHGKTQPPKSTVALLHLLNQHPELLPEVIAAFN